jgi:hypothetical protein
MLIKKGKYRKLVKLSIFVFLIFAIIYSCLWFVAANKLNEIAKHLSYEQDNWKITHEGIKTTGFPFKFKLRVDKLKITYDNKILALKVEALLNTAKLQTGPLFNYIDLSLPDHILVDTYYNHKFNQWSVISKNGSRIKVEELSLINTFKVAELINDPAKFESQEYSLSNFRYAYKNLSFIDRVRNQEIFNSNTDTTIQIQHKSNNLFNIIIKAINDIKFIDSVFVGHQFKDITYKTDISLNAKRIDNKYSSIPSIDINLLNFTIDNFSFNLIGKIHHENNATKVDMELKLKEWDMFTNQLLNQKIISADKDLILKNMIREVSGKENNNDIDIKIYTAKEGGVRVGKIDLNLLNGYLNQFIRSN